MLNNTINLRISSVHSVILLICRPRPLGMELPESVVFTFSYIPDTVLCDLANQVLRQRLVVGNLEEALGSLMLFQLFAKYIHRRRGWREVEVCFVGGESEQESRLHEEGGAPLDRLLRLRRDALQDRVQPPQMRLARPWGSPDILSDRSRTLACHLIRLDPYS